MSRRLNIAYVSPLNPIPNGISDYSEALLPALSELVDVTLYSDCGFPTNPEIGRRFWPRPITQLLTEAHHFDLALYQIGNSDHHQQAFDNLRRRPAVVTLHEPFLHHGLRAISRLRYRRELFYEQGYLPEVEVERWAQETDREILLTSPLIGRLVDTSLGIIVHSHSARRAVEAQIDQRLRPRADLPLTVIPMMMPPLPEYDRAEARTEMGLPTEALIFGVAGTVDPTKEPALILQAFAQLRAVIPTAQLVFAGERPADYGLRDLMRDLGIADAVIFLGRIEPLERLHRAMAACDILINLRRPTIGETSATAVRALALGLPLIVRQLGWFGELPDEVCMKVGPDDGADALARVLLNLSQSPAARQQLGEAGRRYVLETCDVRRVAQRYSDFLRSVYTRYTA